MKTELLLEMYNVENEKFVKEINISHYDLKVLNKMFPPYEEFDYEYTQGYEIEKEDFDLLRKYIKEIKAYNFEDYLYSIITRQIL